MADITKNTLAVRFCRDIARYANGADVLHAKKRLVALGFLRAATKPRFGDESYEAVKAFQRANGLTADGIIGRETWAALFPGEPADGDGADTIGIEIPEHIPSGIRAALKTDFLLVSDTRRALCLTALNYCVDPDKPGEYPRSLYVRGGNLFNKDLSENVITQARIESGAARQPEFYDDGRKEFMLRAVQNNPAITGADCSGGVVGLWRKLGVKSAGFDANANTLYARYCKAIDKPAPGDLAWKSGHIGMYVGAGRIVEWAGGAYGCQLTQMDDRRCYDYVKGRKSRMSAWQGYGEAKYD
jgi:hypothetical protein